jgi:hypothetical protein
MSRRIIVTLAAAAALGSALIATGASAATGHRHDRGESAGYAGPAWSGSRTDISAPTTGTDPSWPEGEASYHGSNGG